MNNKKQWWKQFKNDQRIVLGFLQIDIAKHGKLEGVQEDIAQTRSRLHSCCKGIIEGAYDGLELNWAGDGGSYIFQSSFECEIINQIQAAIHLRDFLNVFNNKKMLYNKLNQSINVRISCHRGEILWNTNLEELYGRSINFFLKFEREIGLENYVTITEDLMVLIKGYELGKDFEKIKNVEYEDGSKKMLIDIYGYHFSSLQRELDILQTNDIIKESNLLIQLGDFNKALLKFESLCDNENPFILERIAFCNLCLAELRKSEEFYKKALDLTYQKLLSEKANYYVLFSTIARTLIKVFYNHDHVLKMTDKLLNIYRNNSDIWHIQGLCYTYQKNYEAAINSYDRAIEKNSNNEWSWLDKIYCKLLSGVGIEVIRKEYIYLMEKFPYNRNVECDYNKSVVNFLASNKLHYDTQRVNE